MITISFNGDEKQLPEFTTITQLLSTLQVPTQGIALANNDCVVPKSEWSKVALKNLDKIEVITIVQGG